MPPQRHRDHTPEGLQRVTSMMDTDELPFKIEDVKDKIYVLKGRDGKIAIEWNEVSSNFNRKQGFGNANKYKREKDESTDDFVARCVQLYIKGKTDYNSEGLLGQFKTFIMKKHILIRMSIFFFAFCLVAGVGFYIMDIFYLYLEFILIKKYSNRRLYNSSKSKYINFKDLFELTKNNIDFKIEDHKTGEDLTQEILLQTIFE